MVDSLVSGILRIFASNEGDSADLCLKMACIDYLKNFYNDHEFKVEQYAYMLAQVVDMSSKMLLQCVSHPDIINEILELYRFIVDKYSSVQITMDNGKSVSNYLTELL